MTLPEGVSGDYSLFGIIYAVLRMSGWICSEGSDSKMKKKKLSEWVVIILIALFFAIPVCSLAMTDSVTIWPKSSTSFVYNLLFR